MLMMSIDDEIVSTGRSEGEEEDEDGCTRSGTKRPAAAIGAVISYDFGQF